MQQRTLCNAEARAARSLPDRSRTAVSRGGSRQSGSDRRISTEKRAWSPRRRLLAHAISPWR